MFEIIQNTRSMNSKYLSILLQKYAKNPIKRKKFLEKLYMNFVWHLTSTELQVQHMMDVLDRFSVKGTFFTTARLLERDPWRVKFFRNHEIAPHGYTHLDYSKMTFQEARNDMQRAVDVFKAANLPVSIFRAPYSTPRLADGTSWYAALNSVGIPYSSSQFNTHPPYTPERKEDGVVEFPVIMPTDDALITYLRIFDSRGMTKELLRKVIQVQTFTQARWI